MNRFKALKNVRRELRVSHHYPVTHLNAAHLFETRTGMMGCVLKIDGIPFVTETSETLNQLNTQLHQAISMLNERFMVYVTIHRKRENRSLAGEFKSAFAARVNEKYNARFTHRCLYRNDIYLTLLLKGDSSGKVARTVSWFKRMSDVRSNESRAFRREQNRVTLDATVVQLTSQLAPFSPTVLGEQDKVLGFSELMQFLSLIPNGGETIPFARPTFCAPIANSVSATWANDALYPQGHLGQYVCSKRILFGDYIQFQGASAADTRFGAMLTVKKYGKNTSSLVLDALLQLDGEFISTHTFAPESRERALKIIDSKRDQLVIADDLGLTQIDKLSELEDDIASESKRLGIHQNTILLLADSKEELESTMVKASHTYRNVDMVLVKEMANFGLEPAFWSQIPGNQHFITRASPITTENFVDFCSLHNEHTGFRDGNHLSDAVALLESVSKTPVYFNYHGRSSKSDPANGHTAIYGATQSGKNTLVAFMDSQMGRYNGRSFFLDRDSASKIYVLASGNSAYTVLSPLHQDKARLNPFQLPDAPENRTFLKNWFAELIKLPNENDVPASIGGLINDCVNYAYDSLSKPYRQLTHVVKCLPRNFPRWPELNRWLRGRDGLSDGEFAWIFDNESDTLSFDYDKVGFDITYLMDEVSSLISTPVYMVLLHRMRQSLDGRLTSFILDEAWQILNSSFWVKVLNDWLPSIRKKNGHFIFMTQSPETVVQSSISAIIRTNVLTTIAFPNPSANAAVYKEGLGFSESEFQTIRDTSPQSRLFLYRQDKHQSMLCRLDLSDLADEIRVFSANEASVKLLDSILNEVGDKRGNVAAYLYGKESSMKRVGLIMVLFLFEAHVHAMLPVVDAGAILQMGSQLKQLKEQYDLMKNAHDTAKSQLSNGLSQLDQLKDLTGANKGSYGFGNLQNSIDELTQRQGSNTWEEALNNLAGGNADRYSQLATAYERMHPTLSDEEYKRGASDTRLALYKQNKAVNKAVTVQTTEAFNQVNKHLQRVHDLSKEIEGKTNKNTKSAIDLNTRLLVETAYIQIGMLKLQALINQQAVQVTANEIAEDSEAARFNQLPKAK